MNTQLHRLYRTKIALLALVLTVGGVLLFVAAQLAAGLPGWEWLSSLPAVEIASAMFTTGLIVVAFEYVDREDAELRAMQRLRAVFKEQAPSLRDSMLETFATDAETLATVASSKTLDGIARNSLAIQLGDSQLAHDVYDDLRQQVIRAGERWRDVQVSVSLAPWTNGPGSGQGSMFEATVRWEYRVRSPAAVQRFSCVSDLDEYRQLLRDPTSTLVWYFEPVAGMTAASPEAFELQRFAIDGKSRAIRKTKRVRSRTFTARRALLAQDRVSSRPPYSRAMDTGLEGSTDSREVVVSYTYRVLVQRHSHVLQLDFSKPSKGVKVQFGYGDCGIRYVNVLDFIAGSEQPRILRPGRGTSRPIIEVGFDGWVWPKAGVGFVWVLDGEMREAEK